MVETDLATEAATGLGPDGERPGPARRQPKYQDPHAQTDPSPLVVDNLAVDLGGRPVLRNISCRVECGEFVGLLGPNGAGKTTLLRSILAVIPTREGYVEVAGRRGKQGAKQVGYVPQRHDFAWDFPISVEQVAAMGLVNRLGLFRRMGRTDWDDVYRALAQVRMDHLASRPIGELSGGQRQRVLIARALVTNPSLLLLDEPFTGLDQPTIDLLLELFTDLAEAGSTLIMSTHDLASAVDSCHRLILLNRTIIAQGTPAELNTAQPWMETYQVGAKSPLLRAVVTDSTTPRPTPVAGRPQDSGGLA